MLCMGASDMSVVSTNSETRVVMLTSQKWDAAKREMDAKGMVKFDGENVVLVVTNGLPNVEHWFIDGRMPINFVGYGHHAPRKEPGGYMGQTLE